jgi:hypothetical protein
MWNEHLQEVIDKLVTTLHKLPPKKRTHIMSCDMAKLSAPPPVAQLRPLTYPSHKWLLPPADIQLTPYVPPSQQSVEQRVEQTENTPNENQVQDQNNVPILTRINDAPPIMNPPNPTQKCTLKLSKRMHSRQTRNNIPGSVTQITPTAPC